MSRAKSAGCVPVDPDPQQRRRLHPAVLGCGEEDRLVAPQCTNCGTFRLPPPPFCFVCQHHDVEWVELPGTGPCTASPWCGTRWPGCSTTSCPTRRASSSSTARRAPGAGMIGNIIDCDVGR